MTNNTSLPFSALSLNPDLLHNLASLGFTDMTPIQAESLPAILDGKDVIAQAKTGSGKTAAFGLGLLNKLDVKKFRIQTLVLCPTRELADQVAKDIRKLARAIHNIKVLTLCGGMPFGPQVGSLEHGAHIVVGTPGRIEDHVNRGTLILDHLDTFVLDEADRMLEMGFEPSLDAILEKVPTNRQTLLFSATFPEKIQTIASNIMNNPSMVKVESNHEATSIQQFFYRVSNDSERIIALRLLLLEYTPTSAIVFCNTKIETQDTAKELSRHGFSAAALHGDLEQRDRDQTLVRFSNKSVSVLVATDVAARGLDIEDLDMVVNFHIARDAEVHTHRIGRTGRAGSSGIACSLFSDREVHKVIKFDATFDPVTQSNQLPPQTLLANRPEKPTTVTLQIDGGKKQKVRPGDILGALTSKKNKSGTVITGNDVGKIQIFDHCAYVAINTQLVKSALTILSEGKIKGRSFRVRQIR
ncbi:MAG: ATP-dependent RNA helicase DbpA [Cellvibrionaceae bacterium]